MIIIPMFTLLIMGGYSWLIGWNFLSALGAWFILVPLATFSLSNLFGLKQTWHSGISMLCLYAWMIFGIYDHYQSDLFVLMMLSLIYNTFILVLAILAERDDRRHTAPEDSYGMNDLR